jgi:soluble lytic murein transglycosylase-like protein
VDRHEVSGDTVKLFANGGVTEMPASAIAGFEPEVAAAPEVKPASPPADPRRLIDEAAERYGVPARLLHSVARAESGYDPAAVSPKGAIGIMQLMPDTARQLGADPRDPRQNVDAGARYLVDLLRKYAADDYQVRKALAAYNAGPGAVDRYNGVPPYRETMNYVEKVIRQTFDKR